MPCSPFNMPHLVNPDTVDVIVRGADLVLGGGSRGDVKVLLYVVHVVEGRHCGQAGGAGACAGAGFCVPPTLQTRLWRIVGPEIRQLSVKWEISRVPWLLTNLLSWLWQLDNFTNLHFNDNGMNQKCINIYLLPEFLRFPYWSMHPPPEEWRRPLHCPPVTITISGLSREIVNNSKSCKHTKCCQIGRKEGTRSAQYWVKFGQKYLIFSIPL